MIEGVDFTESYSPVAGICSRRIIVEIASEEGLIFWYQTSPMPFIIPFYPNLHKYSI